MATKTEVDEVVRIGTAPSFIYIDTKEGATPAVQTLTNADEWYILDTTAMYDATAIAAGLAVVEARDFAGHATIDGVFDYSGKDGRFIYDGLNLVTIDKPSATVIDYCFAKYTATYKTDLQTPTNQLIFSSKSASGVGVRDEFVMNGETDLVNGESYFIAVKSSAAGTQLTTYDINVWLKEDRNNA